MELDVKVKEVRLFSSSKEQKANQETDSENVAGLQAFADISVNGCLSIYGLRVVKGKYGLFVDLPQKKAGNNENYFYVVKTENDETTKKIKDTVLKAYKQACATKAPAEAASSK